jgi:hypothetical protein
VSKLTLENQEVEFVAFGEADKLDDIWVIDTSHNLDFFEDVGSLDQSVHTPSR